MTKYKKAILAVSKLLLNDPAKKQEIENLIEKFAGKKKED